MTNLSNHSIIKGSCYQLYGKEEIYIYFKNVKNTSSIVNEMFSDIMFNLSDDEENYNELTISKDTVTDPKKYILKK